jgi:hypothetical protein
MPYLQKKKPVPELPQRTSNKLLRRLAASTCHNWKTQEARALQRSTPLASIMLLTLYL